MYNAALELGVNPDDMVMEKQSRDTEEEAVYIRQMLGDRKVYTCHIRLSHATITGALFRKQGMAPTPSTEDFLVKDNGKRKTLSIFPSTSHVSVAKRAVYEYLGMAWARLRDKI